MVSILIAALYVTGIGLLCGALLAVASKVMAVKVDENFQPIRECLPGANCGACGYPGCDGYAQALVQREAKTNLCTPGGDGVSRMLSEVTGAEFEDVIEMVAVIKCKGDCNVTSNKMDYRGIKSCAAAKLVYGGPGSCSVGCMALGDCVSACPNNAIYLKDSIAHIILERCTGCGMCVKTCPNGLISLMADEEKMLVTCSSTEKGAAVRKKCDHGCIGCRMCARECSEGAITIVNNLAVIDYEKCTDCGHCATVCVTGCIMHGDFRGIHNISSVKGTQ